MKKLIALTAILSMSVAFADDPVDPVYGTYVLNSSAPEVVLCVPWVNPGTGTDGVAVTDLIQTSTLEDGDQLYYYNLNTKKYSIWQYNGSSWDLDANSETPEEKAFALKRGNAIILKRVNMDDAHARKSNDIIINGQVGTESAGAITMARGGEETKDDVKNLTPAYTLIAPANPNTDTSLDAGEWLNVQPNDFVMVDMKPYYYKGNKWGTRNNSISYNKETRKFEYGWTVENPQPVIKAGQGAWFVAQGPLSEPGSSTTWNPTPANN